VQTQALSVTHAPGKLSPTDAPRFLVAGWEKAMTNRRSSVRVRIGAAVATIAGVVVIIASPASATFPGRLNGKIAYANVDPSGHTQTIWTINPSGRGASELTRPVFGQGDFFPRWSADGKRIVFGRLGNSVSIWTMDALGHHQNMVTSGLDPAWSPDGRWIVFRANTSSGALFKIRSTAPYGSPIQLTHPPAGAVDEEPNWSADGTRIAYVEVTETSTTMRAGIEVLSVRTGKVTKLTSAAAVCGATGAFYSSPNFSPSSQSLLFSCLNPGSHLPETVFRMSASGGTPTKITLGGDPGWSPVPGHIVYTGSDRQGFAAVVVATTRGTDADVVVSLAYEADWQPLP
jgi:Tol biopolymer transport system component